MVAVDVRRVSKRFRHLSVRKHLTLKEAVVKKLLWEGAAEATVEALKNVTFSVAQGEMLGVIGRNGSGKSTLLRLLAGVYSPDQGSIILNGTLTPLLALGVGFHPELTGRENTRIELLTLGLSPKQIRNHMDEIIDFSEIGEFIDVPLRAYSTGMAMRLAFSAAVCVDPDILLLDEVLSVGDEAFSQKCLQRMDAFRARNKTIVLVTHQVDTVVDRCDKALWLDSGKVVGFGDPSDIVRAYHASNVEGIVS